MFKRISSAIFSETRAVRRREEAGLPAVDEMRRFRMLVCCLFCSICTSVIYAFDLFTTDFVDRFQLTVGDQSTISTVGLVFCYFTLPYGFLYDYMGPFIMIVICVVTGGLGSLLLGLTFDGVISGSLLNICIFYALMNMCSGLIDTAYIVTLAEAFPRNRGPVVALAKVMTGLGSSVLASISINLFPNNISGFIYFLMAYCMVVCSVACFVIVLPPYFLNGWRRRGKTPEQLEMFHALKPAYYRQNVPIRRLGVGYVLVAALLIFFTVESPIASFTDISRGASLTIGIITVVLVLGFFIIMMPIRWLGGMDEDSELVWNQTGRYSAEPVNGTEVSKFVDAAATPTGLLETMAMPSTGNALNDQLDVIDDDDESGSVIDPDLPQDPRYGGTIWENLKRPDIWLLLFAFVCQSAIGVIVVYNASTISVAKLGKERSQETSALYTAFLGVGSSLGRMSMGMFEAFVQHQDPQNRRFLVTLALPVSPLIAVVAGVLLLTLPGEAILFPFILVYFEEGVFAAVGALIFPCLYEGNHGVYYNIGFLTAVVSVIGFNLLLFGRSVDAKHDELGFGPDEECNVPECVRMPIIVVTCAAALAAVCCIIIHVRYSRFVTRAREKIRAAAAAANKKTVKMATVEESRREV